MTERTDRELLELAAKAVEIDVFFDDNGSGPFLIIDATHPPVVPWNPLIDDGDALRLAVKLNMKVYPGEAYPWCESTADYQPGAHCDEDECNNPYAATRRAIVRAAAAMAEGGE